MRNNKAILTVGSVIFLASIILFSILTKDRNAVTWISFIFILMDEILLILGLIMIEYVAKNVSAVVARSSGVTILGMGTLMSISISLSFIIIKSDDLRKLLTVQILLLIIILVLLVASFLAAVAIEKSEEPINAKSESEVDLLIDRLEKLKKSVKNKAYVKMITKIQDELKYSSSNIIISNSREIELNLARLQVILLNYDKPNNEEVNNLIEKLINLVNDEKIKEYN